MEKKERILQAALELFTEFGFHHTPTSKIAKRAGVATGTLFYFFTTKDALIKALYLDIKNRLNEYVSDIIKDEKTLIGIMRGHYSATLYWALANEKEFHFIEQFDTSPYIKQIASEEIEKHIKPITDILQKGITDNILKPLDEEIVLSIFSGQTIAINQYLLSRQLPEPVQDVIINETFELLWEMLGNK
jgi:AcrR family transcriptional regulator